MKGHDVLNLTTADRASIASWRRGMFGAVALTIVLTLAGPELVRRFGPAAFGVTVASAEAQAAILSRECAMRDGQYFMRLEEEGGRPGVLGDRVYRAFLAMLEARTLCDAGRQKEAFALYDQAFGPFVAAKNPATTQGRAD